MPILAALWLTLSGAAAASAAAIEDLAVLRDDDGVAVTLRLDGALTAEIRSRIQSGLEVAFEYTAKLRRRRGGLDKTVTERYVVVSVQYSNLTKMYKVTRRVDGAVTDADVSDRPELVRNWMTSFEDLRLFDDRDLQQPGSYYLRVRAKLQSGFKLLFIPWDLETDWAEVEVGEVKEPAR